MPLGITNVTNVTMDNLTQIINQTDPMGFIIDVNHIVYGGILYFVLLWALWAVLFMAAQDFKKEPLENLMYSGAIVTVASFFLRVIEITRQGVTKGLLTDYQMWLFPILTAFIAVAVYATRD